jgi:hypothetical protein
MRTVLFISYLEILQTPPACCRFSVVSLPNPGPYRSRLAQAAMSMSFDELVATEIMDSNPYD